MRNIIVFDNIAIRDNLLPITYTRPASFIRVGITTIYEKWQSALGSDATYSTLTVQYLSEKFPANVQEDNLFVASHIIPDKETAAEILALETGEALKVDDIVIAFRGSMEQFNAITPDKAEPLKAEPLCIKWLYDIFMLNDKVMYNDFKYITEGRKSAPISNTNCIIGDANYPDGSPKIFIEEGATVEGAFLNSKEGPIYVGKDSEIMEGSCIRAPFACNNNCYVNMGAKIYGATTLGPYCKVGGELHNVVMIGYSNKAHDGFLGNAVIGEWCNLGGGTTASNLKNDYSEIKLWNYPAHRFLKTGLLFCGLIMGDHSKAGINCMFNTATVIGVGVNIHGAGFPRNFVASFQEGSTAGYTDVSLTRFYTIAERVMARRNLKLTDTDKHIFQAIYNNADIYK